MTDEEKAKTQVPFATYIGFLKEIQTYLTNCGYEVIHIEVDYQPKNDETQEDFFKEYTDLDEIKEEILVPHGPDTMQVHQGKLVLLGLEPESNTASIFEAAIGNEEEFKKIAEKYNIVIENE